jgi:hypothetical protein
MFQYPNNFRAKTLLGLICCAAGTMALVLGGNEARANAQAATASTAPGSQAASPATSPKDIVGTWQGTLHMPAAGKRPETNLRLVFKISRAEIGALNASLCSLDQTGRGVPMATITFQDGSLKFTSSMIERSYEGSDTSATVKRTSRCPQEAA